MNKGNFREAKISPQVLLKQKQMEKEKKQRQLYRQKRQFVFFVIIIAIATTIIFLLENVVDSHAMEITPEIKQVSTPKEGTSKELKSSKTDEIVKTVQKEKSVQQVKQSIYNEKIPMPKEHQEYLYKLCMERGLDYKKTLATIKTESGFDSNVINKTHDYGYFQINAVNHAELANKLGTEQNPLNPYINMNWGTYMLSHLYDYWRDKGVSGDSLDEHVWSSYNKGITGFKKYGYATEYIYKTRESIQFINSVF